MRLSKASLLLWTNGVWFLVGGKVSLVTAQLSAGATIIDPPEETLSIDGTMTYGDTTEDAFGPTEWDKVTCSNVETCVSVS